MQTIILLKRTEPNHISKKIYTEYILVHTSNYIRQYVCVEFYKIKQLQQSEN